MGTKRWLVSAGVVGFAVGGFFDGILLHQILQWHHLLSLVPQVSSLRFQVLWDGYFHALMYVIAAFGFWGLWRWRSAASGYSGAQVLGVGMIGFGLWHVLDGILSHWMLGIHRIKLDSPNPLVWDLIWFVGFGIIPIILGALLIKRTPRRGALRASAAIVGMLAVTITSGIWALQPPPDQAEFTTVVFRPGTDPEGVLRAMAATDARLVWGDAAMAVVVLNLEPRQRWSLYRYGALLVSGAAAPPGCFTWSRASRRAT